MKIKMKMSQMKKDNPIEEYGWYVGLLKKESIKGADKVSKIGRQVVFAIIAGAWTLSYSNNVFCPSRFIVFALAFAFLYLFFDLLYYLVTIWLYNYLKNLTRDNIEQNEEIDIKVLTWPDHWGTALLWFVSFKTLILLASAILIFVHVISI